MASKEERDELKAAKDAVEVAEILLPKGDIERFERLRQAVVEALREVPLAVREAIRCHLSGREMRPGPMQDRFTDAEEAASDGFLTDTGDGFVLK